jgi:hypothetical protein
VLFACGDIKQVHKNDGNSPLVMGRKLFFRRLLG